MEHKSFFVGKLNFLLALLTVGAVFGIAGFSFDFYYDLNDDVLIRDILSGAYAGTPDGHTVQMLYPLGVVLAWCYNLLPALPWFGIFLWGCMGLCLFLITKRCLTFCSGRMDRLLVLFAVVLGYFVLVLRETVYMQYTVVCGLLAATACFLFLTESGGGDGGGEPAEDIWQQQEKKRGFWRRNLIPVLLVVLAFFIRTEMLALMLPFIGVTGLFRWKFRWKKGLPEYIGIAVLLLIGCGLGLLGDRLAYREAGWQEFRRFFDARTSVYDYTWYPPYEEAEDFYREIGVDAAQYALIDSYNFGLDETIDANTLEKIASYGEKQKHQGSLAEQMEIALWDLRNHMFGAVDSPYNYFVILGYLLVMIAAIQARDRSKLWQLPLLLSARMVSWSYLILAERVLPRVSHPLYYAELLILAALFTEIQSRVRGREGLLSVHSLRGMEGRKQRYRVQKQYLKEQNMLQRIRILGKYAVFLWIVGFAVCLPFVFTKVRQEQSQWKADNRGRELLEAYASQNPEQYYFLDVYTTVYYSEAWMPERAGSRKNYDILGGWMCKSPLQRSAYQSYVTATEGLTEGSFATDMSPAEALLTENFYFCIEATRDIALITEWYESRQIPVTADVVEELITPEGEVLLLIYQIRPADVVET